MERPAIQDDWLQRLIGHPAGSILLTGPAACGKTAVAKALYRHYTDDLGRSGCALIAPNRPTAHRLGSELLAERPGGVLVQPRIMTFADLGERILAAGRSRARPISALQRHLLIRDIVRELAEADEFDSLTAVADCEGLIPSLDRSIAELKRAAIEPEQLARVAGTPGKARDLLHVYRRYQHRLQADERYDVEGQMWQTRDLLRESSDLPDERIGLGGIRAMAVDGFTDFTPTQREILTLLGGRVEKLFITLPAPAEGDGRSKMWSWLERTREDLEAAFGGGLARLDMPPADGPLHRVAGNIFDFGARMQPEPCVSFLVAPGAEEEVRATAVEVKRLLLKPAPDSPPRIAVCARNMEHYRDAIDRIFGEAGLPVAVSALALTDCPVVCFALEAASLRESDFEVHSLLRLLRSSYFDASRLGDFDETVATAAEMAIRQANVLGGRTTYGRAIETLLARLDRIHSLRNEAEDEQTGEAETPGLSLGPLWVDAEMLRRAGEMLESLLELLDKIRTPADLPVLIDELGLRDVAWKNPDRAVVARDLRALESLHATAESLGRREMSAPALREALAQVRLPGPRGESVVDVLDVLDARAMRWDHVFLLGCGEGQFPQSPTESPLLGEADRQAWRAKGLRLDTRRDLTAREMLLFYLAVSRAEGSLRLSYPQPDAAAGSGAFLEALWETLGGQEALREAGRLEQLPPGRFAPDRETIHSPRDAEMAAAATLFHNTGGSGDLLDSALSGRPQWAKRYAAGLWTMHRRRQRGPCNEYDGRLSAPVLLESLTKRYPGEVVFSAGRLSTFGQCPWQYFARYELGLEPLVQPQRELAAVSRGILAHDVLWATMESLAETHGRPLRLGQISPEARRTALEAALEGTAARHRSETMLYPALWRVEWQRLARQIEHYLLHEADDAPLDPLCLHFELSFGRETDRREGIDPASMPEPVEIDTPSGTIRLAGKIDRLDRVEFEGRTGLLVVDYKTSRPPSPKDALTGVNTQMPLYAAAAEKLLGEPSLGGAFHSLREGGGKSYFAAIRRGRQSHQTNDDYEARQAEAMETIGGFVEAMAKGRFDLLPQKDACRYCDWRQICAYSPARAEYKTPEQIEEAT